MNHWAPMRCGANVDQTWLASAPGPIRSRVRSELRQSERRPEYLFVAAVYGYRTGGLAAQPAAISDAILTRIDQRGRPGHLAFI